MKYNLDENSSIDELTGIYYEGNNNGDGFGPGEPTDTIRQAAKAEGYTVLCTLKDTDGGMILCRDKDGDLIVIGDINGPWAVTVGRLSQVRGIAQ